MLSHLSILKSAKALKIKYSNELNGIQVETRNAKWWFPIKINILIRGAHWEEAPFWQLGEKRKLVLLFRRQWGCSSFWKMWPAFQREVRTRSRYRCYKLLLRSNIRPFIFLLFLDWFHLWSNQWRLSCFIFTYFSDAFTDPAAIVHLLLIVSHWTNI